MTYKQLKLLNDLLQVAIDELKNGSLEERKIAIKMEEIQIWANSKITFDFD